MQTSQSLHHYIIGYVIGLHQVFLVLLQSLFVSPNSQGPEDAGVSALRVFTSFFCAGCAIGLRPMKIGLYHIASEASNILCFMPRLRQFHGGCQLGASGFR